jgi:methanogenic corrinoid protein MtbC1
MTFGLMKNDLPDIARDVARHPIAVVAERTGLSQDLLRIWERRYRAVEPSRGAGGHREYSDADVTRLRLLHATTAAGRSISQVARLSTEELARMVEEDAAARAEPARSSARRGANVPSSVTEAIVSDALAATARLDAAELEHVLRRAVTTLGVTTFVEEVVSPLLRRIGDDWHAGRSSIAHEHLVSSTVHDLMTEAMRSVARRSGAAVVLVATPTGERHVIGAALVGAAAAAAGWRVLYLGADLPAQDIAAAATAANVRIVAMSLTYVRDRAAALGELRVLRALLPSAVVLLVGGAGAATIADDLEASGIRVGTTLADLRTALGVVDADAA